MHHLQEYFIPEPNTGCWLWDAGIDKDGYGRIKIKGTEWRAHRYMWFLEQGEHPGDMLVCHSCDMPSCVNPSHLFLGTCADNLADMAVKGKYRNNPEMRDYCPNGHPRSEENIYWYHGKRLCRECRRVADTERYERDKDKRRDAAMDYYWRRGRNLRLG